MNIKIKVEKKIKELVVLNTILNEDYEIATDKIDNLYRKEMLKEAQEAYKKGYIDSHIADLETNKNL